MWVNGTVRVIYIYIYIWERERERERERVPPPPHTIFFFFYKNICLTIDHLYPSSAQNSHFCRVWERWLIGRLIPKYFFGEANSCIWTCHLLLLVQGTCHRTKSQTYNLKQKMIFILRWNFMLFIILIVQNLPSYHILK